MSLLEMSLAALGPLLVALWRSQTDSKAIQDRPPKKTSNKSLLDAIFNPSKAPKSAVLENYAFLYLRT